MPFQQDPLFEEKPGPRVLSTPVQSGSAVMYRVGGRVYPLKTSPTCKTCKSQYRVQVENALLRGYGYTAVVRGLPEDAGLSVMNVHTHVSAGHLPMDHSVRQAAVEERAREVGVALEEHAGSVVDHIVLARAVVQRVYEDVVTGKAQPTVRDGAQYARLLADHEAEATAGLDQETTMLVFQRYMEGVKEVMSAEQLRDFGQILQRDPILQSVLAGAARRQEEQERAGEIVEVES